MPFRVFVYCEFAGGTA